jgi:hypothetical protein
MAMVHRQHPDEHGLSRSTIRAQGEAIEASVVG